MEFKISKPVAMFEMGSRKNQEDSIFPENGQASDSDRLFLVCDGMGGHEHGEVASGIVCKEMSRYLGESVANSGVLADEDITHALELVYDALEPYNTKSAKKMGTTMTMACLHQGGCTVAHIGDSRIYHIRPETKEVLYRSRDHSLVFDLYRAEEITYDEMRTSPRKNIITKAIQPGGKGSVRPDIVHIGNLKKGDYLFLCSDGVLEEMEDDELVDILAAKCSDEDKIKEMIKLTAGNADNHSAYLIHIEDVMKGDGEIVADDEANSPCNAVNIIKRLGGPKAKKNGKPDSKGKGINNDNPKRNIWTVLVLLVAIIAVIAILFKLLAK